MRVADLPLDLGIEKWTRKMLENKNGFASPEQKFRSISLGSLFRTGYKLNLKMTINRGRGIVAAFEKI